MSKIQILAIIGALLFLILIIENIRQRRLKEIYSLVWLFFGLLFLFLSVWKKILDLVARWIGIYYPPAVLFLVLIIALFVILFYFSIVLSRQSEMLKLLNQEIALMKTKLKDIAPAAREEKGDNQE